MRDLVELPRGSQVASEWLFDNDTRMLGQLRGAKPSNHRFEERGRNSEIVRRPSCLAQRIFDRGERGWIFIVSAHILEQREKMLQCAFVIDSARSLDAVHRAP